MNRSKELSIKSVICHALVSYFKYKHIIKISVMAFGNLGSFVNFRLYMLENEGN